MSERATYENTTRDPGNAYRYYRFSRADNLKNLDDSSLIGTKSRRLTTICLDEVDGVAIYQGFMVISANFMEKDGDLAGPFA